VIRKFSSILEIYGEMPVNSMLLWLTQNTLKLVKTRKNSPQIGGFLPLAAA
jgi:hypothetical protein